jgi:hypothetical protein
MLLVASPSFFVYPQYGHSSPQQINFQEIPFANFNLTYDEVLRLLRDIEEGRIDNLSEEELEKISRFIAYLAQIGLLPGESAAIANLESDIGALFEDEEDSYNFSPYRDSSYAYTILPAFLNSEDDAIESCSVNINTRKTSINTKRISLLTSSTSSKNIRKQESIALHKKARDALEPYIKKPMPEERIRMYIHETGFRTFPRPMGIPENYVVRITEKGAGMEYVHPTNTHLSVRVMPGKQHSPYPHQQKPYVVQKKDGKAFDKHGHLVPHESPEAHIPIDEFIYRE